MVSVDITTLSGVAPFKITICDVTNTYCYVVATGVMTAPITVPVPLSLQPSTQILVVVTDVNNCDVFQLYSCISPTPTPTLTPTPTPTMTVNCNCIEFYNADKLSHNYSVELCDGTTISGSIPNGVILYYCGKNPYVDDPVVSVTIGSPCVGNSC